MGLISKNKSSARPARALCILVHFFAVLVLTTTWIDQSWGYVEDVRTWRNILIFFPNNYVVHANFIPVMLIHTFHSEINTITANNIFRVRSPWRRRRPCVSSLMINIWQTFFRGCTLVNIVGTFSPASKILSGQVNLTNNLNVPIISQVSGKITVLSFLVPLQTFYFASGKKIIKKLSLDKFLN